MPCGFTDRVFYSLENTGGSLCPATYCIAVLNCGSHKVAAVSTGHHCADPGAQLHADKQPL